MDKFFLDDGIPSQYTMLESSIGSQVVAQATKVPSNEPVHVKSGPRSDVWETHRSTIKRLYLDEDKTLKEVMGIMERDFGHKATIKMYKTRINKWGLDKNCKAKEMKVIARKKVERDAIAKASSFRIRGRQVEIGEALRHFKRKGYQSLEALVARDKSPRADTPSDIDCATPGALTPSLRSDEAQSRSSARMAVAEAEPIHNQTLSPQIRRSYQCETGFPVPNSDVVRRQKFWMNDNLRRHSSLRKVSSSLEPPRDLLIPELFFSAVKTFLRRGLLDWYLDRDGYLVNRMRGTRPKSGKYVIDEFYESCSVATYLLEQKLFVEARQLLSRACERSKEIFEESHPDTISMIFAIYLRFEKSGYGDTAIKIFEYLRSTATMASSSTHTFRQLIDNMLLLNRNAEDVYFTACKLSEDILEQHLEPFNWPWLSSRLDCIERAGLKGGWQEAERLLRPLSTKCEQICGKSDPRGLEILRYLAWNLYNQGKYKEAEEIGQDIVQCAKNLKNNVEVAHGTSSALEIVSLAEYKQGKDALAEKSLKQCIDTATRNWGEKDPITMRYSLQLERWLRVWGRQEEAMALAAHRTRILGPPEIQELLE